MPKNASHSLMHSCFCLPHVFGAPRHSPWMFLQWSSFFPWLGSGFVNIQWLGSLLGVFVLFLHSHGWEFCVFNVAHSMEEISTNLGTEGVAFSHVKPSNISGNRVSLPGSFSAIWKFIFGSQVVFIQPKILYLLCVHIFLWSELVGSGIGFELAW